jgi:hypothetical protein
VGGEELRGEGIKDMDNTSDKISFIACIIPEFADAYKMSIPNAYNYFKKYGGLQYLYNE